MRFKRLLLIIVGVFLFIVSYAEPYLKAESGEAMYNNHWPAFSIAYPGHWIKKNPERRIAFKAETPESYPVLRVAVIPGVRTPLKQAADLYRSK